LEQAEKKLTGGEPESNSLESEQGKLLGKAVVKHQGKLGWLKVSIEGGVTAIPFIHKGIDWLEQKIPGDQKAWAQLAKDAVEKIKL